MLSKIKRFWLIITNLQPVYVNHLFHHIKKNKGGDPVLYGYKRAILYGKFYFLRSEYKEDGSIDLADRSRKEDAILRDYFCPTDRIEYLHKLRELRNGVEKANMCGYFSCGQNAEQNKIEATYYQQAIDCLDILIPAVMFYPKIWQRIFLTHS